MIENNAVALATTGKNGRPHAIAVACCKIFGDKIIVSNTHISETINNLKINKYVSLAVWNKDWETACAGFELMGTAENQTSGKWFNFVKNIPDNEGYNVKSAIVINVTKVKKLIS